jgi:hypothetical protein
MWSKEVGMPEAFCLRWFDRWIATVEEANSGFSTDLPFSAQN